jgi:hypothetical protein
MRKAIRSWKTAAWWVSPLRTSWLRKGVEGQSDRETRLVEPSGGLKIHTWPSGSAGADVCGAGFGPAVLHDLGAAIVEHEQVLVGLDQIDGSAGQEPGDVEAG